MFSADRFASATEHTFGLRFKTRESESASDYELRAQEKMQAKC